MSIRLTTLADYRRRRAELPLPLVIGSPITMMLSLGRAVLVTHAGATTALTLPYGFGSVVLQSSAA